MMYNKNIECVKNGKLTLEELINYAETESKAAAAALPDGAVDQINPDESMFVKRYWANKLIADYLKELKMYREEKTMTEPDE